ncbi:hypothetical protein PR048_018542 [Dryococelus australis]|uniref:Uncharacterized protein n=1 Tax=Dryococelus australis TaxID=614101 RepID=A0ABQ9HCS2_9NEOP|nr:hypothetical protein PR048_018542 [Dryococelus australis]
MKWRRKREIPEKTRRPTASSGTIPTRENPQWPGRGLNPDRLVLANESFKTANLLVPCYTYGNTNITTRSARIRALTFWCSFLSTRLSFVSVRQKAILKVELQHGFRNVGNNCADLDAMAALKKTQLSSKRSRNARGGGAQGKRGDIAGGSVMRSGNQEAVGRKCCRWGARYGRVCGSHLSAGPAPDSATKPTRRAIRDGRMTAEAIAINMAQQRRWWPATPTNHPSPPSILPATNSCAFENQSRGSVSQRQRDEDRRYWRQLSGKPQHLIKTPAYLHIYCGYWLIHRILENADVKWPPLLANSGCTRQQNGPHSSAYRNGVDMAQPLQAADSRFFGTGVYTGWSLETASFPFLATPGRAERTGKLEGGCNARAGESRIYRLTDKVMRAMAMLILHKAEVYTTRMKVDVKQGFQKCGLAPNDDVFSGKPLAEKKIGRVPNERLKNESSTPSIPHWGLVLTWRWWGTNSGTNRRVCTPSLQTTIPEELGNRRRVMHEGGDDGGGEGGDEIGRWEAKRAGFNGSALWQRGAHADEPLPARVLLSTRQRAWKKSQ